MSNFNMNEMGDVKAHTGSRVVPDAGDYNVVVSDAELETNKSGNGTNVLMEYTILDGNFAGSTVKEWLAVVNNSEQAQNIARSKLQAIRVVTKSEAEGYVSALKNKSLRLRLNKTEGSYNGRTVYNSDVVMYMDSTGRNAEGKEVTAFVPTEVAPVANTQTQSSNTVGGGSQSGDDDIPF